jgi:hypothetical protein
VDGGSAQCVPGGTRLAQLGVTALVFVVTLLLSPETKGKVLVSQLSLAAEI